jgi:hypothetical protein
MGSIFHKLNTDRDRQLFQRIEKTSRFYVLD